jgi:hypothetical protein
MGHVPSWNWFQMIFYTVVKLISKCQIQSLKFCSISTNWTSFLMYSNKMFHKFMMSLSTVDKKRRNAGSEILAMVVMKSYILWDMALCSALKPMGHFRRTCCCLHLQGWRGKEPRKQNATDSKYNCTPVSSEVYSSNLMMEVTCPSKTVPWWWRWHVPPKLCLTFNTFYSILPQNITLHNITASTKKHKPVWSLNVIQTNRSSFKQGELLYVY